MIEALDNCFPPARLEKKKNGLTQFYSLSEEVKKDLFICLGDFPVDSTISFSNDEEKNTHKNDPQEIVVSLTHDSDGQPKIQTGNYLGQFSHGGVKFDIQSRFGEAFLKRMLNFANDIFLDDVDVFADKKNNGADFSRLVLSYLFVQSLEKAYLLGLPKNYRTIKHHEMRLVGRLEINRHIRHDIPFLGKLSTISREQREVQEIVDVLFKAVMVVERNCGGIAKNIAHIKPHLREMHSGNFVSKKVLDKALSCKALLNPIFSPYKKVLRYAEHLIRSAALQATENDSRNQTVGFLVNVAELFEVYITKLLQRSFPDWMVSSPQIELYDGMFYVRKIIPDIVMQRGDDVAVFDTKYKRMNYSGRSTFGAGDVDRGDFFQINSYMAYYQQQGMKLRCGGLLYPLSADFEKVACHADHWLNNAGVKFIVDGVRVYDDVSEIVEEENKFLSRLDALLNA